MPRLQIMDTTIRDGQQSLWATRMQIGDMLPILPKMDRVGYWAIEAWGGATFDSCLRFLDENPWERLRAIKANTPNTPLAMLSRGQNLVGYKHYSKEIVHRFINAAHRNGVEVFRVFDALNDIRNVVDNAEAIKECGGLFEGAISYTISPVHTLDSYLEYGQQLKDLGADTIAIKDMAGMLTPYRAERMVKAFNEEIGLPVHIHCHYVGGMAPANILKAAEAGVAVADTAHAPLAFGNSHPAVEMIVAALKESRYDTDLDLDLLFEISEYWEEMRKRGHYKRGVSSLIHMQVYSHQVPGGMMSNLISQLEVQKAAHRLPEVMAEIPKVRAEVGYPPLVTPMSQIVGTQAVFNVLTGKRWSVISKEMKDYVCGYYGKAPGNMDKEIVAKVAGDAEILDPKIAPGTLVVGGTAIPYRDVRGGTTPSSGGGLWLGSDAVDDGSWGYFVGHNPGSFAPVRSLSSGDAVVVCDRSGAQRAYTVREVFQVEETATWKAIASRVTGYGESVVLQTCAGDGMNVIVVAA